jgi:hypothetical protein
LLSAIGEPSWSNPHNKKCLVAKRERCPESCLIDGKVRQCAWIFCTVTLYGELDMREEIFSNLAGFENILLLIPPWMLRSKNSRGIQFKEEVPSASLRFNSIRSNGTFISFIVNC